MEQAPKRRTEDYFNPDDSRENYTFPPHPSGSHWDLTPDGYEGEDGRAYFADGALDRDAMIEPFLRDFGVDGRMLHRRYLEWAQMADLMRAEPCNPDDPSEPTISGSEA